MMMSLRLSFASASLVLCICGGIARAANLYDGPLGSPPEGQGWLVYGGVGGTVLRTTAGGTTTFDTTSANAIQAGYSNYFGTSPANPAFPVLDRGDGFLVTLDMRVLSESHISNNRAGVSLIVLSNDLQGVELAFWENEVWVQSGPDFIHAEGVTFDTTAASTRYELFIQGNTYAVSAGGTAILTGSVRDYSAFGIPYDLPNFVFLGDNTSSARGSFDFSRLAVVPEPAGIALLAGLLAMPLRRGRRANHSP
jgi:hypothetical protein